MKNMRFLWSGMISTFMLLGLAASTHADQIEGYGQLSGRVTGSKLGVLPVVYAYNTDKNVGYTVFVVNGKFRAVNLIPGSYDVTIRPAVDQLEGFTQETVKRDIKAGAHAQANFSLKNVGPVPNYIGGYPYEACSRIVPDCGATIEPYEKIFPPGPGRKILERNCLGCHQANFISYNHVRGYPGGRSPADKSAWTIIVRRMSARRPNAPLGAASLSDPELLPTQDRVILIDYLAANFGADAPSRVVQLRSEAKLDLKALEKAMFVEYIYHEDPKKYPTWPWGHNLAFDGDGNVWLAYTACCIVRFDPRTGESKAFEGNGSGSGIVVDHTDGTVWYSGDITAENGGGTAPGNQSRAIVKRLDPKTGLVDKWLGGGSIAQVFDSKGNLWMTTNNITKWDRKTDSLTRWGVPVVRSSPYGMTIDSKDKIWFPEHYMGGITRFDPETESFKFFPLTKELPANVRRPGVDSKDMIWAATWASPNREVNGRNIGGTLYRLNPETGEVMGRSLGIEYSNPYNADADLNDNIWVASDNYISMYDQKADTFTHYPIPTRSDTLKTSISRDGAIWFVNRNANKFGGQGGSVVALYPDKDKVGTLAAYYPENSPHYRYSSYRGPKAPIVTGTLKFAVPLRNADEYEKWAIANGLAGPGAARPVKEEAEERY